MYFAKNYPISLLILGSIFSDCVVFYGDIIFILSKIKNLNFTSRAKDQHASPCQFCQSKGCRYGDLTVFTARCYASAVLAMALCPSVCPSVTSRCSTKTAKRRITQTRPHDSPGTLVFRSQRSPRNSTGVTPCEGAECRWGGSKSATFDQ